MSQFDNKPGEPDDALSATGMFLGGFQTEEDPFAERPSPPPPPAAKAAPQGSGPGEFTQMFDPFPGQVAPPMPPAPPAPSSPLTSTPKMRGFSSPGASDTASADGSFTQVFRTPGLAPRPPAPVPVRPVTPPAPVEKREWPSAFELAPGNQQAVPPPDQMGVTDLFRALSAEERPAASAGPPFASAKPPAAPPESFTMLLQKLTEHVPPSPQNYETQHLAPAAPSEGRGEYTRIITRNEARTVPGMMAAGPPTAETKVSPIPLPPLTAKVPVPAVPTAPRLAAPAPPKGKLQEMVPILLVLNAFLMVVLIVTVVLVLMHR